MMIYDDLWVFMIIVVFLIIDDHLLL